MADLKLKRITIRNWEKCKNATIEFPEWGLVLVQGINSASGGALSSVGAGKSSIGEAICRTLLGTEGRFKSMKQFSMDKKGDTYIKLEADLRGHPLVVEAGYKCKELNPNNEALCYHYGGKSIQRGDMPQTRLELNKLLGISTALASWTVFVDGEYLKFNKMSQSDSVELVMNALRQPPWNSFHDAAKTKLSHFKRDAARNQQDHQLALASMKSCRLELDEAKEVLTDETDTYERQRQAHAEKLGRIQESIAVKKAKIKEANAQRSDIEKELKKLEAEKAERAHQAEIKLNEIDEELQKLAEGKKPIEAEYDRAVAAYTKNKTNYDNYKSAAANCPTCNRPRGEIDPAHLEKLDDAMAGSRTAYTAVRKLVSDEDQKIQTLQKEQKALNDSYRKNSGTVEARSLSEKHEQLFDTIEVIKDQIHALELEEERAKVPPSKDKIIEAQAYLANADKKLLEANVYVEKKAAMLVEDQEMMKVLEYWNMAFSPYGIPNMILREVIAPLNKEARRVSAAMTGGTIDVRYSTTKELASGMEKAQLNIEVDNKLGDKDLSGSSKGEAGLTNIIISETLSEIGQVGQRIGFKWLDEVVPHQDPLVCNSLYSYMRDMAQKQGILIFLVDHNPAAANYADHVLIVEKKALPDVHCVVRWKGEA